ncbi:demethylmenaquinone methyltransferase [Algibacter lectus]|uniref:Putative 4-hydroxy-4-methyl-2-oxoglutarate aldolase n=1 Tax=Algibacter lectus TaxID=221126 RepID=A0A090WYP0_9FLAO|nr:RraA family protein [Algibacter lectus]GAL82086.1 demethylmenaquinone methyltransferase [Algibacter lectus]
MITQFWNNDDELFEAVEKELFTAVVGDAMDKMHLFHQFLPPEIKPLKEDMFLIGRAMPVLEADTFEELSIGSKNPLMSKPFGLMLEALDDLKKNEVYICAGASPSYALVGELMMTRAKMLGAAGAVANGYSRDTFGMLDLDLPIFSYGNYAQDQGPRGKVIDFRVPIEMNGVRINPGDIVIGDIDGVCVVPQAQEVEVFLRAFEKARGEKVVLKEIQNGMSALDAWNKYQIM